MRKRRPLDIYAGLIRDCRDDPARFSDVVLRSPKLWHGQVDFVRAVAAFKTVVCVSGNATGKDYAVGRLIPWWIYTRPGAQVFVTGPSQTVLGTVTWKEVRRALHYRGPDATEGPILPIKAHISSGAKASPLQLALDEWSPGWGALGYSTTSIERASGQHNANLLVIVEEASSADDDTKEAIRGLNPSKLVLIGNPIRSYGWFRDLARRGQREEDDPTIPDDEKVRTIVLPSTASPDIHLARSHRGLADRGFLDEARADYGEESLWWKSHVLAQFPDTDDDALIPSAWLDAAEDAGRNPDHPRAGKVRIAIDLGGGGGGDRSEVLARDDNGILAWEWSAGWPLEETARRAGVMARIYGVEGRHVTYDRGGLGHDFDNRLRAQGIKGAFPYLGGKEGGKRFSNLRTAAAWAMRQRLDRTRKDLATGKAQVPFAIRPDHMQHVRAELEALRYKLTERSKTALLPKEEAMKVLGRSPDAADAMICSWAIP
jgi:phage terminase large subunit